MVAAKAGRTRAAVASAAVPETKLRLFNLSSLARAQPAERGEIRGDRALKLIRQLWRICQCDGGASPLRRMHETPGRVASPAARVHRGHGERPSDEDGIERG